MVWIRSGEVIRNGRFSKVTWLTQWRLADNMKKWRGWWVTASGNNADNTRINRTKITRKQKWEEKYQGNKNGNKKQLYRHFKQQTSKISHEKTRTWLRKASCKRETESLRIAAQKNAIITNHIKTRIDSTQQNRKYRSCDDRDETINHIISKCNKLVQKQYKTRHDRVGKGIHWELFPKFKFGLIVRTI